MSIRKLTDSIRNYSESELCFGTIKTLKMIDDKAAELERENTELKKLVKQMRSALTLASLYIPDNATDAIRISEAALKAAKVFKNDITR